MKLSIMLSTDMNMGDHGEIRQIAIAYVPDETIEKLMERIRRTHVVSSYSPTIKKTDVVEIRAITE